MPRVSVIIPTHNRAEFLRSAIASVLNQTFQDFEIIVVDDASPDNTAEVVRAFDDKRIKYIRHDTNKKEAGSRNTGVAHATGEYVAFLDDDDEWLSRKLELQVRLLDSSPLKVGGIYTGVLRVDKASGRTLGQLTPRKRGNIFNDMAIQNWVGTPSTVLLRKECFAKAGLFDDGIVFGVDYDMWIRVSKLYDFEYVEDPLIKYHVHSDKLSTNRHIMIRGLEAKLRKYGSYFASNTKGYSHLYLSLGVLCCYEGEVRKGRKAFFKAIKLYPFEIRHYFNLFLSLLGSKTFRRIKEFKEQI